MKKGTTWRVSWKDGEEVQSFAREENAREFAEYLLSTGASILIEEVNNKNLPDHEVIPLRRINKWNT